MCCIERDARQDALHARPDGFNSREGTEPGLLEEEFKGKTDWRTLDPSFIDQAPDGFGTAFELLFQTKRSGSTYRPTC